MMCSQLKKLSELLLNADVDIRISAGEAIALLYELARADDEVRYVALNYSTNITLLFLSVVCFFCADTDVISCSVN